MRSLAAWTRSVPVSHQQVDGLLTSPQSLFDVLPEDLNYNVTGWLTYDEQAKFPAPAILDDFDNEFDDFELVPHDRQPRYTNPDQSITLEVEMDNLGDGAN